METTTPVHDPLMFGAPQEDIECVMEDLNLTDKSESSHTDGDNSMKAESSESQNSKASINRPDSSPQSSPSPEPYATYGQLVSLPSYEDSMLYTKTEASTSSTTNSNAIPHEDITPALQQQPAPPVDQKPREQLVYISVCEPLKKEQLGLFGIKNSYVLYKVATKTTLPSYRNKEFSVRRRFREVVELAEVLRHRFRGYFVPPRPEKNAVEGQRMKDTFVEERRVALDKYLNMLARHPVIAKSDELRLFLEVEGELSNSGAWAALKPPAGSLVEGTAKLSRQLTGREASVLDPMEAAKPNRKASNLLRTVKESVQGFKSVSTVDMDELSMRKQKEELEGLRDALSAASRAAETVVAKQSKVSTVYGDMALAFLQLSKFEEVSGEPLARYTGTLRYSGNITAECRKMAASCLKVSKMTTEVVGRSAKELQPLHDHLSYLPSAIRAFGSREHQLLTQHTLEAELEVKRRSVMELEASGAQSVGASSNKAKRVEELRGDCQKLEMAIMAAKQEYNKIKEANTTELLRLTNERTSELKNMVEEFSAVQAAAAERNVEVWFKLAHELGAEPADLAAVKASEPPPISRPSANGAGPSTA